MKGTLMKINILNKWIVGVMSVLLLFSLQFPIIMHGGEYKYDNYVWLSADQDLQEKDFTDICFINEWDALIAVSANKIVYSKISYDPGWTKMEYPDNLQVDSIVLDPMGRIILQTKQQIWIRDNLRSDWVSIEPPPYDRDSLNQVVFSFYSQEILLFAAGTDLFVYEESSWKGVPNPNHLLILTVQYQQNTGLLLVGTVKQGIWLIGLKNGNQARMQIQPEDISVSHLFFSLNETNAYFASTKTGEIYRSFDEGKSWTLAPSIGHNNEIFAFCEDEARIGVFFAFSRTGIYLTADHGTEWIPMQHLIEETEVRTGFYHPYEERYYVATRGKGIRYSFAVPNKPAPIQPKNGTNTYFFSPMLAWELYGGNDLPGSYHVLVGTTPNFAELIYEKQNIVGDSIIVPENVLALHTPYFWKVRVETQYWNSDWSSVFSFTLRQRWQFMANHSEFQWNEKKHLFHDSEWMTPFIDDGTFYLPVRFFMEKIGAIVTWESDTRHITIRYKNTTKLIALQPNHYVVQIRKSRSYIPLRHLADFFDWEADWDAIHQKALLSEP
ncbi:MAG: copper amine oxidase N-terminal domain-containing protein [Caldisericia bacterium]|nr:copper amine oxidase N-terminal domain-containing protein [Caldisericia bacterium]